MELCVGMKVQVISGASIYYGLTGTITRILPSYSRLYRLADIGLNDGRSISLFTHKLALLDLADNAAIWEEQRRQQEDQQRRQAHADKYL